MWKMMVKDYKIYMLRTYTKLFCIVSVACLVIVTIMLIVLPLSISEHIVALISRILPVLTGVMLFFLQLDPFTRCFDEKDMLYKTLPDAFQVWKNGCMINMIGTSLFYGIVLGCHILFVQRLHQNANFIIALYGINYAIATYMACQVLKYYSHKQLIRYSYVLYLVFSFTSILIQMIPFSLLTNVSVILFLDILCIMIACYCIINMMKTRERMWLS